MVEQKQKSSRNRVRERENVRLNWCVKYVCQ
jgi:hypothetical protein